VRRSIIVILCALSLFSCNKHIPDKEIKQNDLISFYNSMQIDDPYDFYVTNTLKSETSMAGNKETSHYSIETYSVKVKLKKKSSRGYVFEWYRIPRSQDDRFKKDIADMAPLQIELDKYLSDIVLSISVDENGKSINIDNFSGLKDRVFSSVSNIKKKYQGTSQLSELADYLDALLVSYENVDNFLKTYEAVRVYFSGEDYDDINNNISISVSHSDNRVMLNKIEKISVMMNSEKYKDYKYVTIRSSY
jgi:hypothetical protein